MSLKPFFPYYGSKWSLARHYPAPNRDVVIEPFAGAAGYSTYYAVPKAILIDKDPIISGVWDYLMRVTPEEILGLPDLPNAGDGVDDHALPQEARWLIGFWLNRGSATPKKRRTAYSARTDKGQLNWGPRAKARIAEQLPALDGWSIQAGDYSDSPDIEACWHIDPPYEDKGRFYRHARVDYEDLAPWAASRVGQVIVCEGAGAEWLPFADLGDFKTSTGKAKEKVFLAETVRCPSCLLGHPVDCGGGICDCCASLLEVGAA